MHNITNSLKLTISTHNYMLRWKSKEVRSTDQCGVPGIATALSPHQI